MKGRLSNTQLAMGSSDSSITKKLSKIQLAATRLVLWDSMGWDDQSYKAGEIGYILDGNIPNGFDLTQPIHARYVIMNRHRLLLFGPIDVPDANLGDPRHM